MFAVAVADDAELPVVYHIPVLMENVCIYRICIALISCSMHVHKRLKWSFPPQ